MYMSLFKNNFFLHTYVKRTSQKTQIPSRTLNPNPKHTPHHTQTCATSLTRHFDTRLNFTKFRYNWRKTPIRWEIQNNISHEIQPLQHTKSHKIHRGNSFTTQKYKKQTKINTLFSHLNTTLYLRTKFINLYFTHKNSLIHKFKFIFFQFIFFQIHILLNSYSFTSNYITSNI